MYTHAVLLDIYISTSVIKEFYSKKTYTIIEEFLPSNIDLHVRREGSIFSSGEKCLKTRLYSSRMSTASLLPVSPSMHCAGVPGPGRVSGPRGCAWSQGGSLVPGVRVPGRGGVSALGVSQHAMGQTPSHGQNSWLTLLKILPCPNFVAGGNNKQAYFLLLST